MIAFITSFLLFVAFLLLLLATLSVPIIKSIFLMDLDFGVSSTFASASDNVHFGVWGWCTSGASASLFGISKSTVSECSKPHLGYTFDSELGQLIGNTKLANIINKGITGAMVLHPIVTGLTFLALALSFLAARPHRVAALVNFGLTIFTAFLTTIVFIIDVCLVAVAKHRVAKDTDGTIDLSYGNALWLVLVAAILLWASTAGSCLEICSCGRRRRNNAFNEKA